MNFLYVGFNKTSKWRTLDVTLDVLDRIGSVCRYGYGFSTDEELSLGIDEWIKKNKLVIDFIVCDSGVFECPNLMKKEKPFRSVALNFKEEEYYKTADSLRNYFLSCKYKKLFIANWDYYNLQKETIDFISQNDVFVLGWDKSVNTYLEPKALTFEITNCWHEFTLKYSRLIISANHFISDNEFNYTPLSVRSFEFDIPGAGYAERKKIVDITGLNKTRHYWMTKGFTYLVNYLISVLKYKKDVIDIFHSAFDNRISNTRICYTSGSELGAPVRKYFEIPSKGTLLVCTPFHGMQHLGFKHLENCVLIDNPDDVADVFKLDIRKAQRIARNGLALIKEKHSSLARYKQWKSSFNLIMKGDFKGSTWQDGEYINMGS